jgi:hypothetical protein
MDKIMAREVTRQIITDSLRPMLRAQIAHAQGIWHVYTRDKTGKFTKIENEAQAHKLLTEGTEGSDYWIFMKDPSTQAFSDLLNRALDKPTEAPQELHITGSLDIVTVLKARHARHARESESRG